MIRLLLIATTLSLSASTVSASGGGGSVMAISSPAKNVVVVRDLNPNLEPGEIFQLSWPPKVIPVEVVKLSVEGINVKTAEGQSLTLIPE